MARHDSHDRQDGREEEAQNGVQIDQKQIAFYSEDYAKRARYTAGTA